jgi:hypothetical protein
MPPPINSQSDRRCGDAWASRGNHTRGTETTRPSVSVTESESFEHDTSTANASVLSVEVFIPSLQEQRRVLNYDSSNLGQLIRTKTPHIGDRHGIQPKLGITFGLANVNMRRLERLPAEEKEPVPPNSEDSGHLPSLPPVGRDSRRQAIRHGSRRSICGRSSADKCPGRRFAKGCYWSRCVCSPSSNGHCASTHSRASAGVRRRLSNWASSTAERILPKRGPGR